MVQTGSIPERTTFFEKNKTADSLRSGCLADIGEKQHVYRKGNRTN
jgi:hypothetical protein